MAACDTITREPVRATVSFSGVSVKTPFVKSFNVSKSRDQTSNTFSASLEVSASSTFTAGGSVSISAGIKDNEQVIFTGDLETTQVQPVFGKPDYYLLNISGRGVLSRLEGKTFTRRLTADGQGLFCTITGGAQSPHLHRNLATDKTADKGSHTVASDSPNPAKATNSPLVVNKKTQGTTRSGGLVAELAKESGNADGGSSGTGTGTGTGELPVHDHTDLDNGGPAFGVYSAD